MTSRWISVPVLFTLFGSVAAWGAESTLVLDVATEDHPHVRAIQDGRVTAEGCRIHFSTHPLAVLQKDLTGAKLYDVAEVELLPFLEGKSSGGLAEYTLLPVFLSRGFQMRNVFIRTDRGIHQARDLRGKTVGVTGIGSTTVTWLKGILQSSWSVTSDEITWLDTETTTGTSRSLSAWLTSGKVDAIFSPDPPKGLGENDSKIERLFPDFQKAEYDTFKVTRIFPIVSALAIRQSLVDKNPWLPEALFLAFSESKKIAMADLTLPLPWGGAKLDETEHLMGENFWSYGVKNNPKTLSALFRYAAEQGLFPKPLKMDDVFEPSTMLLLEN